MDIEHERIMCGAGKVRFILQLETAAALDGMGRRPLDRLRAFIKKADRAYGLKCTRVAESGARRIAGGLRRRKESRP